MPLDNISEIVRGSMAYERSRAEVASYNLAIANVAIGPGDRSPLLSVSPPTSFAGQLGLQQPLVHPQARSDARLVHDPAHPMADHNGMVHYPNIEAAREMATLVSATRAYEANIRSYNSLREMTLKAFEIGK
ncbi:flagellar basal-body rod protein FlgC [Pseudomonas sp. SJZ085]|uniref:flagellar basal body rod protein FlgC n=1 Tax=unclassified Pseudomonas TaxID=196821 RepID=UPI00119A3F8E|nr:MULTISPECIES: flagellar basal body rod C-terminal domain-containing protein [unclassified Pseudomonas]TWC11299.1 flagellar basal-body rod protein FlgC [Pseudomonas sp. SJZ074]TWC29818.1 flagellar basal-body rod protein FlgC [Pseudomonas sp. SJZ085]